MSGGGTKEVGKAETKETTQLTPFLNNLLFGINNQNQPQGGQGGGLFGEIFNAFNTARTDISEFAPGSNIGQPSANFFRDLLSQPFNAPAGLQQRERLDFQVDEEAIRADQARLLRDFNVSQSFQLNPRTAFGSGATEQFSRATEGLSTGFGQIRAAEQRRIDPLNLQSKLSTDALNLQSGATLGGLEQRFLGQQAGAAGALPSFANLGNQLGLQHALQARQLGISRGQNLSGLFAQAANTGKENVGVFPIIEQQPDRFGQLLGAGAGLGSAALLGK